LNSRGFILVGSKQETGVQYYSDTNCGGGNRWNDGPISWGEGTPEAGGGVWGPTERLDFQKEQGCVCTFGFWNYIRTGKLHAGKIKNARGGFRREGRQPPKVRPREGCGHTLSSAQVKNKRGLKIIARIGTHPRPDYACPDRVGGPGRRRMKV